MKTILGLLMLAASLAAHGQVLRCVDKAGKVEFASECPPGTTAQQTGIRNNPAAAPAAKPAPSTVDRQLDAKKRATEQQEAEQKAAKQAAEDAQRKQACDQARGYLKTLETGGRVTRNDPVTGERTFLEDSQRAAEIAVAQQSVSANCR